MVKEAYCSDETAKLLKEKGFDQPCTELSKILFKDGEAPVLKVTQQTAMAWLRLKRIYIFINISLNTFFYCYTIYNERNMVLKTKPIFMQYEEAAESAIQYCLTNLV